ncbi:hypothetical protein C8Q77DRAFT_156882 [Trametes polyzona]|nr:hypothetical protein C8Q77DRAFT_156882 [Trametes polyzona]
MYSYGRRQTPLAFLATLVYALSAAPQARAYCYIDDRDRNAHVLAFLLRTFHRRRCTISTGVRIAIAIASVVAFLAVLATFFRMRKRAQNIQRANLAYVGTGPPGGQPPPGYPGTENNAYYYPASGYGGPAQGYTPQYPPASYAGQSPYQSPYGPPGTQPQYAPPPGPPSPPQGYASPPGPPPAQGGYAPPPGPPPAQGGLPQYAPPPGPPPAADQKQAV